MIPFNDFSRYLKFLPFNNHKLKLYLAGPSRISHPPFVCSMLLLSIINNNISSSLVCSCGKITLNPSTINAATFIKMSFVLRHTIGLRCTFLFTTSPHNRAIINIYQKTIDDTNGRCGKITKRSIVQGRAKTRSVVLSFSLSPSTLQEAIYNKLIYVCYLIMACRFRLALVDDSPPLTFSHREQLFFFHRKDISRLPSFVVQFSIYIYCETISPLRHCSSLFETAK